MCGIAGFVDFNNNSSEELLKVMTQSLEHRGPDGQGLLFLQKNDYQLGFGHRRLSIIDLSVSANQPMSYDGLHLVFNGEIYNYAEIRQQLIELGHQFVTHSDTEVILHSWRQWGADSISRWIGMFAIVLYDEKSNEIIAIRDRAGVKPLYYSFHNKLFCFGSELKALIKHTGFKKEINVPAVANFLQYGYVADPHCIYKYVNKLSPGHLLRFNLGTGTITTTQYWNVYQYYSKPKLNIDLPEAIEQTERILKTAFQYRMVADVPVGIFLSGGYDSTSVAAILQANSTQKIKTFTIGTTDSNTNEAIAAKHTAQYLGTDHTEHYCTAKEAIEIIPKLPLYFDEPFADSSAIPTVLVSSLARQSVTVALSADAGDEVFAGYNRYNYVLKYGSKIEKMPPAIRKMLANIINNVSAEKIPFTGKVQNFYGRYDKFKNLLNDASPSALMKNLMQVFTATELSKLFSHDFKELTTAYDLAELEPKDDLLAYMMAVDYKTYLVGDILQKVDRATMCVGLEGREPFLDHNIIEWAAQLPSNYKYYKGEKKYILKQIVHKYIPKQLMDRPKTGFSIPIEQWLKHELKGVVKEHLSVESLNMHGLFNVKEVENILNAFYNNRTEKYLQVWYLLTFQMWYNTCFNN